MILVCPIPEETDRSAATTGEVCRAASLHSGKYDITGIPVILCDEWSEQQVKAFRLMVNRSVDRLYGPSGLRRLFHAGERRHAGAHFVQRSAGRIEARGDADGAVAAQILRP